MGTYPKIRIAKLVKTFAITNFQSDISKVF